MEVVFFLLFQVFMLASNREISINLGQGSAFTDWGVTTEESLTTISTLTGPFHLLRFRQRQMNYIEGSYRRDGPADTGLIRYSDPFFAL